MTIIDHLFFFALAVVYPVMSMISFGRLKRRLAAGEEIRPGSIYRSTILGHWAFFAVGAAIWLATARPWPLLGFGLELDTGFLVGAVLTLIAIVVLVQQYGSLDKASKKTRASFERELGDLKVLIPGNDKELTQFYGVSATAGIVEETLWRGYMFWYLGHAMPLWAAAILTSVLFGVAHSYQGASMVPKVILVGGVFAGLYMLTGSLWLPMILHAVFDAVQGRAAYNILSRAPSDTDTPLPDESA